MQKTYARKPLCLALSSLAWLALACGGEPKPSATDQSPVRVQQPKRNPDLPVLEKSAVELQQTFDRVVGEANQRLAKLVAQNPAKLNFQNTFGAFEELQDPVNAAWNRAYVLMNVSPIAEVMDKAQALNNQYTIWNNELSTNGAVYKVLKAFAKTNPKLAADKQKLLADTLLRFERNGLTETGQIDPRVITIQREMSDIQTQISDLITAASAKKNYFTAAELEGLTPEQLATLTMEGDSYVVLSGARGTIRDRIMAYATKEATRKRAKAIYSSQAQEDLPLVTTLVRKRVELAKILGYNSWADYRTASYMAKNGATASGFVDTVSAKLHPKLTQELAALSKYLVQGVNDDNGQVDSWDVYYFKRLYETNELNVDYGALTKYFPFESVLNGMLRVYEQAFGLKMEFVEGTEVWHPDVRLVKISDRGDDDAIGYVYFDLFPRLAQGKANGYESDAMVTGRRLPSGKYRKPVNAVLGNFPVDANGAPLPMLYVDIEMLFHEFGHALHCVLGEQRFASQYGFNTPQDFVEVPSSLSEYWIYSAGVFKAMAIPHPDLTDAFIASTIASIRFAQTATKALYYERQFGFGKTDFALHNFTDVAQVPADTDPANLAVLANRAMAEAYLPYPEGSSHLTSFDHILTSGYDAGYYAYAWSDSIAAELAAQFEAAPKGYLDPKMGMRYRKEILAQGATRDVNVSVEAFLGKPLDPERKAFLKVLGLQ